MSLIVTMSYIVITVTNLFQFALKSFRAKKTAIITDQVMGYKATVTIILGKLFSAEADIDTSMSFLQFFTRITSQ